MNVCTLLGNLGKDAELRVLGNDNAVLKFTLATTDTWKDKEGNKQEKAQWHQCELWGKRATALASHLTKGSKIVVVGSIDYGSYEKDGVKKYTTTIKVSDVHFAGGKKSETQSAPVGELGDPAHAGVGSDEIPF